MMRKHGFGLGAWMLALALTACGDGGGDTGPTLGGIDANTNGVRDDIERYIEKKYTEPAQRKAAMQTARAFQQMLLVSEEDSTELNQISANGFRAIVCLDDSFAAPDGPNSASVLDDLQAMTTNTKTRQHAYRAYNKARSGTVSTMPRGDACD